MREVRVKLREVRKLLFCHISDKLPHISLVLACVLVGATTLCARAIVNRAGRALDRGISAPCLVERAHVQQRARLQLEISWS